MIFFSMGGCTLGKFNSMGGGHMNLSDYMGGRGLWKFNSMGGGVEKKVPSSPPPPPPQVFFSGIALSVNFLFCSVCSVYMSTSKTNWVCWILLAYIISKYSYIKMFSPAPAWSFS